MKRLFTFAIIVSMVASFTFAVSPKAMKATPKKIEKVAEVKANVKKANEMKARKAAQELKAATPVVKGTSVLRTSKKQGDSRSMFNGMKPLELKGITSLKLAKNTGFSAQRVVAHENGVTVTTDAHGIITNVAGEVKAYTRSADGVAYFPQGQKMYIDAQSGTVQIVEDGDNVYIKNPVSRYSQGSWVKGVKSGNTISVATYQPLAYNASYGATLSLRWGVITVDGDILAADSHADAFTFTVDGDTLTLEGTESFANAEGDAYFMGVFWDDDDSFTGYGDAETVLTYDPTYEPPSLELVEVPETATVEDWYFNGLSVTKTGDEKIENQECCVAFDGNDIYVQGLDEEFPASWFKGTLEDGVVTFDKLQFVGYYADSMPIWVIGYDEEAKEICDLKATYDADLKTLSFTTSILYNAAEDRVYYLSWYKDVVLSAEKAEIVEPIITELTSEVPYFNGFDSEAEKDEVGIYDANDDDATFSFSGGALQYHWDSSKPGDDYAVFPGLPLKAGEKYVVSVDARASSSYYAERFEIVAGTVAKASALTISVIPPTDLTSDEYATYANYEFSVEEDCVYYFAIHAISDADQYYAYFDNFSVKAEDPFAPAPVADLAVAPFEDGSLKATVKFTVPAETVDGTALTGDLDVVVKRDGEEIMNEKKAPGAAVEFIDMVPAIGTYDYSVQVKSGNHISDLMKVSAYVGEEIPGEVENIVVLDKLTAIDVTWDMPSEGKNGGVIVPDNLTYNVYPVEIYELMPGWDIPITDTENPYFTGLTDTHALIDMDTMEGEQGYRYVAVSAENAAGEGLENYGAFFAGAPYELPWKEDFAGGNISSFIGLNQDAESYDNYTAEVTLIEKPGTEEYDVPDFCVDFNAEEAAWLELQFGKIALAGAVNPVFKFEGAKEADDATFEVSIETPDGFKSLGAVELGEEFATKSFSLVEFKDAAWVRIYMKATFTDGGDIYVGNLKVYNELDNNLAALSISAPSKVKAGDAVKVSVVVENQGKNDVAKGAYFVELNCNDEKVATLEGEALASDAKATFEFEVPTTILSPETLAFKAVVDFQADEDLSNNATKEVTTKVALNNLPAPEELSAEVEKGAIKLTWNEPSLEGGVAEEVTEDFEDADAFSDEYGDWKFVDNDGALVGGIEGMDIPGITIGETAGSFWVWDADSSISNESFAAHSGSKFLFTMFNYDSSKQSDWAISPELSGDAQTISFWAKSYTDSYGLETVSVYVSKDTDALEDFRLMPGSTKKVPAEWTEYSFDLPAGSKYFAIVCESQDVFMLFVDDVTFTPAGEGANLELAGYNVYRDGEKINNALVEETTYADANFEEGVEYSYVVSAVYTGKGESPASNEVVLTYDLSELKSLASGKLGICAADGKIVVVNAEGKHLTVSAVNGAVVYDNKGAQKTTISVAPGVYMVKAGKTVVKVIVK